MKKDISAEIRWLQTRRNVIVVLRLIVFSIIYLIGFQERKTTDFSWIIWLIGGIFLLSEFVYLLERHIHFLVQRVLGWIFIFDMLLITILIYFMAIKSFHLSIVYFTVIAIAAMSKSVGMTFITTLICSVFYLVLSTVQGDVVLTEFITRPLFFFGVALFSGYLAEEVNIQHKEITHIKSVLDTSEGNYRELVTNSLVDVYQSNLQGDVLFANEAMAQLLGYGTPEELMGMNEAHLYKNPEVRDKLVAELKEKGMVSNFEAELVSRTGAVKHVLISATFDGRLISGVLLDITERKQSEEEKGKLQTQLLQAQKMETIGQMVGGIAHDFNNILGAIKGYGELGIMETDLPVPSGTGRQTGKTNPIYEYLQHIVSSTDRGANLTKQLLIFSQSHSVDIKSVDLNKLVNNLLKMLDRLIGEDVSIETKLSPDLSNIKADDGNIEQVLMNLVINARDAMPNGGKIIIKTENMVIEEKYCQLNIESRCGSFVCLSVTDTGIGMTKDVLSHIFEPFFTTKPQGKGTGLGLSVVYGIVKKHQGWVNVYSEPKQGTVFRIYLPVSAEKAQAKPDTKIITHSELKGKGERILVVEDDEGIRKVITNALGKMNYKVFSTSSGQEAREMFDSERGEFDLILSDMVLPDVIGIDLCDELVKKKDGLKILLSSGYPSRGDYSNLIRERGLPFIPKPYNLQTLFKTIREILTP